MRHWKFYAIFVLILVGILYLWNSIITYGTEEHFINLQIAGVAFMFSVACWLDYKKIS